MNAITDSFRALVRRKLWPLAVVLVGALVAVPVLLAKEPVTASAPAANAKTAEGMPATFVSAAESTDGKRRLVLGESKDPFAPRELTKAQKAKRAKAAKKAAQANSATAEKSHDDATKDAGTTGGGGGGGGGASAETPVATPTPTPAPSYPLYSVKVDFGKVDGAKATKTIERLKVLPNTASPVLVYRGVDAGGKHAIFEITGTVVAQGDGACEPTPEDCQVLKLAEDETEFITVSDTGDETDAQYQLSVEKIHAGKTSSAAELKKASSAGRELLGALGGGHKAHYAFDPKTGTLRKLDAKSAKQLNRATRRASW
jgi:hypothetical protein